MMIIISLNQPSIISFKNMSVKIDEHFYDDLKRKVLAHISETKAGSSTDLLATCKNHEKICTRFDPETGLTLLKIIISNPKYLVTNDLDLLDWIVTHSKLTPKHHNQSVWQYFINQSSFSEESIQFSRTLIRALISHDQKMKPNDFFNLDVSSVLFTERCIESKLIISIALEYFENSNDMLGLEFCEKVFDYWHNEYNEKITIQRRCFREGSPRNAKRGGNQEPEIVRVIKEFVNEVHEASFGKEWQPKWVRLLSLVGHKESILGDIAFKRIKSMELTGIELKKVLLIHSISIGSLKKVRDLINSLKKDRIMIKDINDTNGDSLIHICIRYNGPDRILDLLLNEGFDKDLNHKTSLLNNDKNTVFHLAAMNRQLKTMKQLFGFFNPSSELFENILLIENKQKKTIFNEVARKGDFEFLNHFINLVKEFKLEGNLDLSNDRSVLIDAAECGLIQGVILLVELGFNPFEASDERNNTLLHVLASKKERLGTLELLLSSMNKANLSEQDYKDNLLCWLQKVNNDGNTLVHQLVKSCDIHSLKSLRKHVGHDIFRQCINLKNSENQLPLHLVSRQVSLLFESILDVSLDGLDNIEKFKIVNSFDIHGKTALHYAASEGFDDNVELLLKNGANPLCFKGQSCNMFKICLDKDLLVTLNLLVKESFKFYKAEKELVSDDFEEVIEGMTKLTKFEWDDSIKQSFNEFMKVYNNQIKSVSLLDREKCLWELLNDNRMNGVGNPNQCFNGCIVS